MMLGTPQRLRVAWLGPVGTGGGVPSMGTLLMESVLRQGISVEYFAGAAKEDLPGELPAFPNLTVTLIQNPWQWGRWYSRTPLLSFVSGNIARIRAYGRAVRRLVERHRAQPFDCILQFSQSELFALGRHLRELPPLVVYPCVHAAGELRWHRRESAYARQSECLGMHLLVRLILKTRAILQRRSFHKPAMVLGMSKRFVELAAADYDLNPRSMGVLYHPIRVRVDEPIASAAEAAPLTRPLKLLYVSRLSVRKGLEQIVELSHRLDDLGGRVQIDVIGSRTQWSDYTAHLRELNPRVARYVGSLDERAMLVAYDAADILLVPSMYEPGGLVVGEALSSGVCVVASDEVGSAEPVDARCCRRFAAGNVDGFEQRVRELIDDVTLRGPELRLLAMRESVRHFEPSQVGARLVEYLRRAIAMAESSDGRVEPLPVTVGMAAGE